MKIRWRSSAEYGYKHQKRLRTNWLRFQPFFDRKGKTWDRRDSQIFQNRHVASTADAREGSTCSKKGH